MFQFDCGGCAWPDCGRNKSATVGRKAIDKFILRQNLTIKFICDFRVLARDLLGSFSWNISVKHARGTSAWNILWNIVVEHSVKHFCGTFRFWRG